MVHLEGTHPKPIEDTFFLDEETADVHFLIVFEDEENSIPAHKFAMASESKVFKAMFYGPLRETGDVRIVDVSSAAFTEFLRFIYANQMNLSVEIIADVMNLANQYQVAECMTICEQFLENHLPNDDVFVGFELAVFFNRAELKAKFTEKVGNQLDAVIKSDRFLNCSRDTLKNVLDINNFLCDPKDLFNACLQWAKKACEKDKMNASLAANQRKQLGDCLYMLPFCAMTPIQIYQCVNGNKGLFDQQDLHEILSMAATVGDGTMALDKFKYKSNSTVQWNINNQYYNCYYRQVDASSQYWVKKVEVSSIHIKTTNRLLGAIKLLEIRHVGQKRDNQNLLCSQTLSGTLNVIEKATIGTGGDDYDKIIFKQSIKIDCNAHGSTSQQYFRLVKSVLFEKDKKFEIQFVFDSSWADKVFHAVVPYPNANISRGIVHSALFCNVP